MQKETYLGVNVSPFTYEQILEGIEQKIDQKDQATIFAVNPEKIMKAKNDHHLRQLLNQATFQIPDGIGVILASKLHRGNITSRVTGVDLAEKLLAKANEQGYRVYFYGAKEEVGQKMQKKLTERFPDLKIAGYSNGYRDDSSELIQDINEAKPHMLFVALGSPKQEEWISKHKDELNVNVIQGVGGTFDVLAGEVKRAPAITQKLGIEWLYRLVSDPKRIKRQLALPKFLLAILFKRKEK
ncbi:WecB/TagA/CpsF family glycosyltransferase [Alkalibacillus aidingensis]|uniref:WecB/TagA/CpsF family glycosyltransferase n=1 Tax=Alkalibacillus aidingensis TaxID=2747607 RepID=UPI00166031A4|nr:WecB/TagA/CpsF family glycosyltransferase [Alkalibacillus aidingensis]